MKRCPQCEVTKPLDQFPIDRSKASGRMSRCRACDNEKARQYYRRNRDRVVARTGKAVTERYRRDRAAAIEVYGGKCSWCGSADELEFDHVDDNGGEHRRVQSHLVMYRRIAKSGQPIADYRLRLLCRSCHRGRGWKVRRTGSDTRDRISDAP